MAGDDFRVMIDWLLWIMLISAILVFARVILGPTVPDRIVATDVISMNLSMMIVLLSLKFDNGIFLDIALAFSILAFADVLIMAKYFEHGELHE